MHEHIINRNMTRLSAVYSVAVGAKYYAEVELQKEINICVIFHQHNLISLLAD